MELTDTEDTVKHTDETVWADSRPNVITHLKLGRKTIQQSIDNNSFTLPKYTIGISGGQDFDFGDKKTNYFKMVSIT
jgi:alpha-amylase